MIQIVFDLIFKTLGNFFYVLTAKCEFSMKVVQKHRHAN